MIVIHVTQMPSLRQAVQSAQPVSVMLGIMGRMVAFAANVMPIFTKTVLVRLLVLNAQTTPIHCLLVIPLMTAWQTLDITVLAHPCQHVLLTPILTLNPLNPQTANATRDTRDQTGGLVWPVWRVHTKLPWGQLLALPAVETLISHLLAVMVQRTVYVP